MKYSFSVDKPITCCRNCPVGMDCTYSITDGYLYRCKINKLLVADTSELPGHCPLRVEAMPCPFCGNPGDIYNKPETGAWVADCSFCDCVIGDHFPTRGKAIEAWNRRINRREE